MNGISRKRRCRTNINAWADGGSGSDDMRLQTVVLMTLTLLRAAAARDGGSCRQPVKRHVDQRLLESSSETPARNGEAVFRVRLAEVAAEMCGSRGRQSEQFAERVLRLLREPEMRRVVCAPLRRPEASEATPAVAVQRAERPATGTRRMLSSLAPVAVTAAPPPRRRLWLVGEGLRIPLVVTGVDSRGEVTPRLQLDTGALCPLAAAEHQLVDRTAKTTLSPDELTPPQ